MSKCSYIIYSEVHVFCWHVAGKDKKSNPKSQNSQAAAAADTDSGKDKEEIDGKVTRKSKRIAKKGQNKKPLEKDPTANGESSNANDVQEETIGSSKDPPKSSGSIESNHKSSSNNSRESTTRSNNPGTPSSSSSSAGSNRAAGNNKERNNNEPLSLLGCIKLSILIFCTYDTIFP